MDQLIHIEHTIDTLKNPQNLEAIPELPVHRQGQIVGYLRAVPSELKGMASTDARLMAEWRNAHRTAFFTWINSTEKSTENWLARKYSPDNRDIIFMIETTDHIPFGHVALYNFRANGSECEFGRVLRGPGLGPIGGMTNGSLIVLLWATMELQVSKFFLEVFDYNKKAISLYERLGFVATNALRLRRTISEGIIRWEKIPEHLNPGIAADGYALRMETTAEQLRAVDVEKHAALLLGFPHRLHS